MVTEQEAYDIATDAYAYFYPMVTMEVTRRQCTNHGIGAVPGFGPANLFSHMRAYPDADFKTVVRPNFDTLYSIAWLDITSEPIVLTVPDSKDRYYLLPILDMWSDVFASPGWRTSGTQEQHYAIVPPTFTAELPEGLQKIVAPTPYSWMIGRIKTDGPEDYSNVHAFQDGLKLTPLSQWGKSASPVVAKIDGSIDMKTPPLEIVNSMSAADYFALSSELMTKHSPHVTDWSTLARLQKIGIQQGKKFDFKSLSADAQKGLERGAKDSLKTMSETLKIMGRLVNGWLMNTDTMGVYGNYYLKRAVVTLVGLGANQPEDAVYPMNLTDADGQKMDGNNNYVLHFEKSELPPVNAFWSLTMYDKDGYPAANSINRFAVSSWMPFNYNSDGSLDLYIQNTNPGADKEVNWLPAPKCELGMTMRLYAPKASVLECIWNPPAIKKAK
ncbi:MAG: DUF1254 domain-containing protein [Leptolyngbya sp.]|nr:DUF1254 domain-containing protein [Candidatus Melainabacteria bacterium]